MGSRASADIQPARLLAWFGAYSARVRGKRARHMHGLATLDALVQLTTVMLFEMASCIGTGFAETVLGSVAFTHVTS